MTKPIPSTAEVLAAAEELGGGRRCLVGFSRGKDSIALVLALREAGWAMTPYYTFHIPPKSSGELMSFEEESLAYYERHLFDGAHIVRLPSPQLYRWLREAQLQPPWRAPVCLAAAQALGSFDYDLIQAAMKRTAGLPARTLTALGSRAADSAARRLMLHRCGAIDRSRRQFFPVAAWSKSDVVNALRRHEVRLPSDYKTWQRSFDGIDAAFLGGLRRHFPRDYQHLLAWFPLAEADLFRWKRLHA